MVLEELPHQVGGADLIVHVDARDVARSRPEVAASFDDVQLGVRIGGTEFVADPRDVLSDLTSIRKC